MPELPEVETIRRTLNLLILNETIESVEVHWDNIIKHPELEAFKQHLIGETFHNVNRLGKFLLFELDDYVLVSHLRMEGKYRVVDQDDPLDKHTHVIFHLTSNRQLRYNDVRKFGTMHLFKKGEELKTKPLNQLGPEPFADTFTFEYFKDRLGRTTRMIKAVLLDQSVIAGLGNIYVDEVLFKARIHPERRAHELTGDEVKRIKKYTIETLEQAIEQGGTTIRSYVDGDGEMGLFQQQLFVYGQENEPCQTCGELIIKLRVSGRGTHICPTCQQNK